MSDPAVDSPQPLVPERVRAVVFDLDGTLADSYAAIATSLNRARAARGLPAMSEDEVRRAVGHGLDSLIRRHVGPDAVDWGMKLFREEYSRVFLSQTRPLPGAVETLRRLARRGFALAVASNKPAGFSERILDAFHVLPLVGAVLGPEEAGAPKPDPAMIRLCLRCLGVRQRETVYVGDMVLDVESAARAGVSVVLVRGGSSADSELEATGQVVLPSLAGLLDLLPERVLGSWRPESGLL